MRSSLRWRFAARLSGIIFVALPLALALLPARTTGAEVATAPSSGSSQPKSFNDVKTVVVFNPGSRQFSTRFLRGPTKIFIFGMNPFIDWDWKIKYDDNVVALPAIVFSNQTVTPTTAIAMPTPNTSVASSPAASGLVSIYAPDSIIAEPAQNGCDKVPIKVAEFQRCVTTILNIGTLKANIQQAEQDLQTAGHLYNAPASRANTLIAEFENSPTADKIVDFRMHIAYEVLQPAVMAHNKISALQPWPNQIIAADKLAITAFKGLLTGCLSDCIAPDDEQTTAPTQSNSAKDKSKTPPAAPPTSQANSGKAKSQSPKSGTQDPRISAAIREANDALDTLAFYDPSGLVATRYTSAYNQLTQLDKNVLQTLNVDRFGFLEQEQCEGLSAGERDHVITLALDSTTPSVALEIQCPSRLTTSTGVAITYSPIHNYQIVAPASSPPSSSTSSTVAGTVVDSPTSSYNPVLVEMAHFHVADNPTVPMVTVGLGITGANSTQPLALQYFAGLANTLYRTLYFSYGVTYGPYNALPAGYFLGQTIQTSNTVNVTPVTKYNFAPFFSVTIGPKP